MCQWMQGTYQTCSQAVTQDLYVLHLCPNSTICLYGLCIYYWKLKDCLITSYWSLMDLFSEGH